jgi:hypothetical protein
MLPFMNVSHRLQGLSSVAHFRRCSTTNMISFLLLARHRPMIVPVEQAGAPRPQTVDELRAELEELRRGKAAAEKRADELARTMKATGTPTHVRL